MNYNVVTKILKTKITSLSHKNMDWVTIMTVMMIISNYKQFQNDFVYI